MKKIDEMKFVGTYAVDDDYRVDVFENDVLFEAWLYNKGYGTKNHILGWYKVQDTADGRVETSLEEFLDLIDYSIEDYIEMYEDDFEDD